MSEETLCPLCASPHSKPLFWAQDVRHGTPGYFAWKRCASCGLAYLSPQPSPHEMELYYPEDYALFRTALERRAWWRRRWVRSRDIQRRCRDAECLIRGGRVLDVGCGTGEFLAAMRERGWAGVGVEPIEMAAAYAREQLGLDVRTGRLEAVELPDASFDVVTLWTVLEHLHDPVATLRIACRLLEPDGLLILSIPDAGSLDARFFGSSWVGYDTPRHLCVFSRSNLLSLLSQSGFGLWRIDHSQADYYTFLASFSPWLETRSWPAHILAALGRLAKLPGLRLLTWPAFWLVNLAGKGCIATIYARPKAESKAPSNR